MFPEVDSPQRCEQLSLARNSHKSQHQPAWHCSPLCRTIEVRSRKPLTDQRKKDATDARKRTTQDSLRGCQPYRLRTFFFTKSLKRVTNTKVLLLSFASQVFLRQTVTIESLTSLHPDIPRFEETGI